MRRNKLKMQEENKKGERMVITEEKMREWDAKKEKEDGTEITPKHYNAKCACGRRIDPYVICDAYEGIQRSAHHHAVKKLLRAGQGHKAFKTDIKEVIDSLQRLLQQIDEDFIQ